MYKQNFQKFNLIYSIFNLGLSMISDKIGRFQQNIGSVRQIKPKQKETRLSVLS